MSTKTVTFWAELWWPMESNSHGEAMISPKFGTQGECVTWIRAHKIRRGLEAQVGAFRRTSTEGRDYHDEPMSTLDAPMPEPEKVHDLVEELKGMLEAKKHELDRSGPGGRTIPVKRPATTMDPLEVRMLTYDEVYDAEGNLRFNVDANGYPTP